MVQIIRKSPTFGQVAGEAIGTGLGRGLNALAEQKMQSMQQSRLGEQLEAAGLVSKGQGRAIAGLPPQAIAPTLKSILQAQQNKALGEQLLQSQGMNVPGITTPPGMETEDAINQQATQPGQFDIGEALRSGASPQQILPFAKFSDEQRSRSQKQDLAERKFDLQTAQFSEKLGKEIEDAATKGYAFKEGADLIKELDRKGQTDSPEYLNALQTFGLGNVDYFKAPGTVLANSLMKNFRTGFTDLFGRNPNQAEFKAFEGMMPSMLQTKEGRTKILDYFSYLGDLGIQRQKEYDKLIQKGVKQSQLRERLNSKMGKYREKAYDKLKSLLTESQEISNLTVGSSIDDWKELKPGTLFEGDDGRKYRRTASGRKLES